MKEYNHIKVLRGQKEIKLPIDENFIFGCNFYDYLHFNCINCSVASKRQIASVKKIYNFDHKKISLTDENIFTCSKCLREKKIKQKYGTKSYTSTEEYKQKLKEKYGVENVFQLERVKKKIQKTNLEKYGVENYTQTEEYRQKTKKTNLEKYGVENPVQNDTVKQKIRKTLKEKYEHDSPLKIKKSVEKFKNTRKNNVFSKIENRLRESNLILLNEYSIQRKQDRNVFYNFQCLKCEYVFKDHLHSKIPLCPKCFPKYKSIEEQEIISFIKNICSYEIKENDRKILNGKEIDILVPEKKFAIEFNGLFWHCDKSNKEKNYHYDKFVNAKNKGINLLHIFSDDWKYKRKYVEYIISQSLGIQLKDEEKIKIDYFGNFEVKRNKPLKNINLTGAIVPRELNFLFSEYVFEKANVPNYKELDINCNYSYLPNTLNKESFYSFIYNCGYVKLLRVK